MLRVLRRHAGLRAPSRPLLSPFCRGVSECDASRDPQAHPPSSDSVCIWGQHSSRSFMPAWLVRITNAHSMSFKAMGMAKPSLGHAYSSTAKKEVDAPEAAAETKSASSSSTKTLDDFQHEEIVGPTVDRDMSPLADELRNAHLEMREAIQKFSKAMLAVGVVHLVWGGMMFRVLDSPFSHALMTQVGASALVLFGLAYYSKQALKPIEFFTRLEERSRLQILTLSLQITKTLGSFFQRSYGVGLVLFVALIANLVGCVKLLL